MNVDGFDIATSYDDTHAKLLRECYEYAKKSKHPSTHNAALLVRNNVIVLAGVNNLPPGVLEKPERFESPNKHIYLNHAERDLVFRAASFGTCTRGLLMVMPWLPCILCANAIISAGISTLLVHKQMIDRTKDRWHDELRSAVIVMHEAGIKIIMYDGVVGARAYMHEQEWDA